MKIIVDAFGGDNAPLEMIKGAKMAQQEYGVQVLLSGERDSIAACAKENGLDMATKVSLQLQLTDPTVRARDRVIKKSEKSSLYEAMDFASIWLERALAGK